MLLQTAQTPCAQHSLHPCSQQRISPPASQGDGDGAPGGLGSTCEAAELLLAWKNTGDALAEGSWDVWDQTPEVSLRATES